MNNNFYLQRAVENAHDLTRSESEKVVMRNRLMYLLKNARQLNEEDFEKLLSNLVAEN